MASPTPEAEYAAFEEKVKRTVYLDNLSPYVSESVVRTALSQFGDVMNVHFIPNYLASMDIPHCALVEMENAKQADAVVAELRQFAFMMQGMPRPVRALPAKPEMFYDRPAKPGRQISFRWVTPDDPDFEVAQKLKRLTRRHEDEASFLQQEQLKEEEKLANQQNESLKANYKKYEMLESVISDRSAHNLAKHYHIGVPDE